MSAISGHNRIIEGVLASNKPFGVCRMLSNQKWFAFEKVGGGYYVSSFVELREKKSQTRADVFEKVYRVVLTPEEVQDMRNGRRD